MDFSLSTVESVSDSQLQKIACDLMKSTNSDELVSGFQFLGKFCTSGDDAGPSILDADVLKFVSSTIQEHKDKKVKIHAAAFLMILSFSSGKYKPELVSDISLALLANVFQESSYPKILEVVKSIEIQFHSLCGAQSGRPLEAAVLIIDRLGTLLAEKQVNEEGKASIINLLSEILDGDFFSFASASSSSQSSSSSPSSPSSSSSFSASSAPSFPPSFLTVLGRLVPVLDVVKTSSRKSLRILCIGLLGFLKENFGVEGPQEGKEIKVEKKKEEKEEAVVTQFVNNPNGGVTLNGLDVTFSSNRSVFYDLVMTTGIYKLTVAFIPYLMIGIVQSSNTAGAMSTHLQSPGSLYFGGGGGNIPSGFYMQTSWTDTLTVGNGTPVGAEVNMSAHTLHFTIGGQTYSRFVASIPSSVQFGLSNGNNVGTVKFISLMKLSKTSVDVRTATIPSVWK